MNDDPRITLVELARLTHLITEGGPIVRVEVGFLELLRIRLISMGAELEAHDAERALYKLGGMDAEPAHREPDRR